MCSPKQPSLVASLFSMVFYKQGLMFGSIVASGMIWFTFESNNPFRGGGWLA